MFTFQVKLLVILLAFQPWKWKVLKNELSLNMNVFIVELKVTTREGLSRSYIAHLAFYIATVGHLIYFEFLW